MVHKLLLLKHYSLMPMKNLFLESSKNKMTIMASITNLQNIFIMIRFVYDYCSMKRHSSTNLSSGTLDIKNLETDSQFRTRL